MQPTRTPLATTLRERLALLRNPHLANRKGMTLVEIMIVVTIMASIMAIAGVYVFDYLEEADVKKAEQEVATIANGAETCYAQRSPRKYPSSIEEVKKCGHIKNVDTDPWGNEYKLEADGKRGGTVRSFGPDGTQSDDDLVAPYGKVTK